MRSSTKNFDPIVKLSMYEIILWEQPLWNSISLYLLYSKIYWGSLQSKLPWAFVGKENDIPIEWNITLSKFYDKVKRWKRNSVFTNGDKQVQM